MRVIRALLIILVFAQAARAQSTLNFVHGFEDKSSIAIVNTSSNFADVQFTLYQPDGTVVISALVNPVTYHIPPKGQLSKSVVEIFGAKPSSGWIQATSKVGGLAGQAADVFTEQMVPLLFQGQKIRVTNPGTIRSEAILTFYDTNGNEIKPTGIPLVLNAHAQAENPIPAQATSVRVSSDFPVSAGSFIDGRPLYISGQPTNVMTTTRVVSMPPSSTSRALFLINPDSEPVTAFYSLAGNPNVSQKPQPVTIPGHGSVGLTRNVPNIPGYIRIESSLTSLIGVLEFSSGNAVSVIPLQTATLDQMVFSQTSRSASLSLVNTSTEPAKAEITLSNAYGQVMRQKVQDVGASQSVSVRDLVPSGESTDGSFVTVRVTGGRLYGTEVLDGAGMYLTPQGTSTAFVPNAAVNLPAWLEAPRRSTPGDIRAGDSVEARAKNVGDDATVFCAGRQIDTVVRDDASGSSLLRFNMPQIEPGYVNCKIQNGGLQSLPVQVQVMDAAGTLTAKLSGEAFYQKTEVTDAGLDLDHPTLRPIRDARIEVFDTISGKLVSVSESDDDGRFIVAVPPDATDLSIQAVSRLRSLDLKVEDNTNGNQFYVVPSGKIDMREAPELVSLVDRTRRSGAFNILEQIQRANEYVHLGVPQFGAFPFTIFWSEKNQKSAVISIKDGLVGTTFFSLTSGTAYVLGDRNTDSDEFDDSVLIHEYAHMLAAKVSRDDSPGGIHHLGDKLDPRLAWSEGWANFFSAAVRNDSIYRDSTGPGGGTVLRFDLEENHPAASVIGYESETSVQALLWDFLDEKNEPGDLTQIDFAKIWAAFTELSQDRYVYLPYFLDHLEEENVRDPIQRMAQDQGIDYQPGAIPSVTNPFPSNITFGSTKIGEVDSLSTKRTNLDRSAHFYKFSTSGGLVNIQLSVGLGTLNIPNADDLDLFLFDSNGKLIAKSESGKNGQPESLTGLQLPAGAYVIEVRSYFISNRSGSLVFNDGKYSLTLSH